MVVDDLHIYRSGRRARVRFATRVLDDLWHQSSMAVLSPAASTPPVVQSRARPRGGGRTLKGRQSWRRPNPAVDSNGATGSTRRCPPPHSSPSSGDPGYERSRRSSTTMTTAVQAAAGRGAPAGVGETRGARHCADLRRHRQDTHRICSVRWPLPDRHLREAPSTRRAETYPRRVAAIRTMTWR